MTSGFAEFEFDLPSALLAQLISLFDSMAPAQLSLQNVAKVPNVQGVYQLLHCGHVVYIGKTDAEAGLNSRLKRHAHTIQHRRNLSLKDVSFRAIRVFVFTAMDLETQLIKHFHKVDPVSERWNKSGFGSNDPGRNRDQTKPNSKGFDARYPVDLDLKVNWKWPVAGRVCDHLAVIINELPYTVRVQKAGKGKGKTPHKDLLGGMTIASGSKSIREVMDEVMPNLPRGWQCTALAGRIILYKERKKYRFGSIIARS